MSDHVTESKRRATKVRAFLAAIRVCPSITRAARSAGIRPGMHYRRYGKDSVYTAAFDEAWKIGISALEDAAVEKAMIGYEEPVIFKGQLQYTALRSANGKIVRGADGEPTFVPLTVFRPNPTLHMFVLRGAKPEKYRERYEHKVDVTDKRWSGTLEDLLILYQQTLQASQDETE